ncbi:invasion associated locus B family protein [Bosea sp. BH3]|nr:invasion associated locus B family protein [Bosea sp. BH3]
MGSRRPPKQPNLAGSRQEQTLAAYPRADVPELNITRCALSQSQTQQSGQRVLTIEINAPIANKAACVIVLPFGLALASGAGLQIEDRSVGQALPFRTCLPIGPRTGEF